MPKYNFTKEDIEKVYEEVNRRLKIDVEDAFNDGIEDISVNDILECRNGMLQGVYSVLMVLSADWPEVRWMCDEAEEAQYWEYLGYGKDVGYRKEVR